MAEVPLHCHEKKPGKSFFPSGPETLLGLVFSFLCEDQQSETGQTNALLWVRKCPNVWLHKSVEEEKHRSCYDESRSLEELAMLHLG